MPRKTTEPTPGVNEDYEMHPSWIVVGASHVQHGPKGKHLFDSEIYHNHYVNVTIYGAQRKRMLNNDWIGSTGRTPLISFSMSEAQWGAFVSSFGQGDGVPATMEFYDNEHIPEATFNSRLDMSAAEVQDAGNKALDEIQESFKRLKDDIESNSGKKAVRESLRNLEIRLENAPKNMKFASEQLTEHVENVVTKAKADIEAAVRAAEEHNSLTAGDVGLLNRGEE